MSRSAGRPDLKLTLTLPALTGLLTGQLAPSQFGDAGVGVEGDAHVLARLLAVLDDPDPDFAIVTP